MEGEVRHQIDALGKPGKAREQSDDASLHRGRAAAGQQNPDPNAHGNLEVTGGRLAEEGATWLTLQRRQRVRRGAADKEPIRQRRDPRETGRIDGRQTRARLQSFFMVGMSLWRRW